MQLTSIKIVQRIREEFEELSGLRLTVQEAAQFFALDPDVCARVLTELSNAGFLLKGLDRRYARR